MNGVFTFTAPPAKPEEKKEGAEEEEEESGDPQVGKQCLLHAASTV